MNGRIHKYPHCVLLLLLWQWPLLYGQINLPAQRKNPALNSEFSKQTNTWNWSGFFRWSDNRRSAWHWQVNGHYRSNLLVPALGPDQWKDETNFTGYFYYGPSVWLVGIYSKSWLQSDKQISADNRFANHALGMFGRWQWKTLNLTPYVGYQNARNRNKVDWGWDVGLKSHLRRFEIGDYRTDLLAQSDYDFYDQRRNYENRLDLNVGARFNPYSGDSLRFVFSQNSKQYYAGDSIEQVQIYQRLWQNKLYYNLSARDMIILRTALESREISYFNGRNVFSFRNILQYYHVGRRVSFGAVLRTSDETQDNAGTLTDSRNRQTAMNFQIDYNYNARNRFNLNLAYVKMQYDTPDSVYNNDDRDEQRFVFTFNYFHRFSPLLTMNWQAYAYLFHRIYIFKEQSQNNNWNRVYKLNPRLNYRYGCVFNRLSTQVLANYTVYDFDALYSQPRSFIFRKYTLADSLTLHLFSFNYLGVQGRLELEDKGSFYKQAVAQQILQSYQSEFVNVFLSDKHFLYFNVTAGYTMHRRREWRYLPVKKASRNMKNYGPYLNIVYHTQQKLFFSAYVAYSLFNDSAAGHGRYYSAYLRLHCLI